MIKFSTLNKFQYICCFSYANQDFISWNLCPYVMSKQLLKSHLFDLFFHSISSETRLPVDEPALTLIITHYHAKDLCAPGLGPLRI